MRKISLRKATEEQIEDDICINFWNWGFGPLPLLNMRCTVEKNMDEDYIEVEWNTLMELSDPNEKFWRPIYTKGNVADAEITIRLTDIDWNKTIEVEL